MAMRFISHQRHRVASCKVPTTHKTIPSTRSAFGPSMRPEMNKFNSTSLPQSTCNMLASTHTMSTACLTAHYDDVTVVAAHSTTWRCATAVQARDACWVAFAEVSNRIRSSQVTTVCASRCARTPEILELASRSTTESVNLNTNAIQCNNVHIICVHSRTYQF